MNRRSALAFLGVVLTAACARSAEVRSATPTTVDPVGSFDFTATVDGAPIAGRITIRRDGDAYTGTVGSEATGEADIHAVSVEGMTVRIGATLDSPVELVLQFTNLAEFGGTWSYGGMSGPLTGMRRTG